MIGNIVWERLLRLVNGSQSLHYNVSPRALDRTVSLLSGRPSDYFFFCVKSERIQIQILHPNTLSYVIVAYTGTNPRLDPLPSNNSTFLARVPTATVAEAEFATPRLATLTWPPNEDALEPP